MRLDRLTTPSDCQTGRPLLDAGPRRTAPRASRDDWAVAIGDLDVEEIDPGRRRMLAEHWTRIAAREHASVASFGRFSLQLLALGAPPGLLAATQQAAGDEVEHARFAYGLASRFAGQPIGPGPLELGAVADATDVATVVRGLVEEACVRQTIGVVEARDLAARAHPALVEAFTQIATDEAEHAALFWAALAWMVDALGPEVGQIALDAIDDAVAVASGVRERTAVIAPELGALSSIDRAISRVRALEDVIAPLRDEMARRVRGSAAAA